MKSIFIQFVILTLVTPTRFARADKTLQPKSATEVKGQFYLQSCQQIIAPHAGDYEKMFVENATDNGQLLQLLYDGGLIFSKLFNDSLLIAAGVDIAEISKSGRPSWRKMLRVANKIESIARMPKKRLNRFISRLLDVEQSLAAQPTDAVSDSPNYADEIRFNQIRNLIVAIKSATNRDAVESVFRDVVSQWLLSFARQIWFDYGDSHRRYSMLDLERPDWQQFFIKLRWATFLPTIVLESAILLAAGYGNVPFLPVGVPAMVGVTLLAYSPEMFHRLRARQYLKKASAKTKIYILPDWSSADRTQLATDVADLEELGPQSRRSKAFETPFNENRTEPISIQELCKNNLCSLTPLQIAYMGDIDLLQIEGLLNRVRATAANTLAVKSVRDELRTALQEVIQSPTDYNSQMALRFKLVELAKSAHQVAEVKRQILNTLIPQIDELKKNFAEVKSKPYTDINDDASPESRARARLAVNKINTDLARIERISLDAEKFQASIERSIYISTTLSNWKADLPQTEQGWREAAELLLSQLDRLEATP